MPITQPTETETHAQQLARLRAENQALREQLRSAQGGDGQSHLARLRAENQALRDQLRCAQRLASLGTMTAMVAHEFNNILTPIINYAQLAQTNPAMTQKAISRAADGGKRASSICKAILGIARNDGGPPAETNLAELISETISAIGRDPKRDEIELIFRAPRDLRLVTRKVELQQVLLNLLLNARTAVLARSGPRRIEVVTERSGRRVVLGVRDNGVGIAPENLKRVFEPFFTTRRDQDGEPKGHGLGLAICSEIVASMGGEITVESEPGRGTTFLICLPA